MRRRWIGALTWLATFGVLVTLACDPEEPPRLMYAEDFETVCDGAPCGWSRTMGEANQATWVETIHPGEHALRLEGEVTVRGPAAPEDARRLRGNSVGVSVANRCDIGNSLVVDVVMEDDSGMLYDASVMVRTLPTWSNPTQNAVFNTETIVGGHVVAVIVRKGGASVCEVGDITVNVDPLCMDGCC